MNKSLALSLINRQIKTMTDKIMDTAVSLKKKFEADGLKSEVFNDILKLIKERMKHLS